MRNEATAFDVALSRTDRPHLRTCVCVCVWVGFEELCFVMRCMCVCVLHTRKCKIFVCVMYDECGEPKLDKDNGCLLWRFELEWSAINLTCMKLLVTCPGNTLAHCGTTVAAKLASPSGLQAHSSSVPCALLKKKGNVQVPPQNILIKLVRLAEEVMPDNFVADGP